MLVATGLQLVLWYLTFLHPLFIAARLCNQASPSPGDIANSVCTLVILWLAELVDALILANILSAQTPYVILRIGFCLYLTHPTYRGGTALFYRFIKPVVDEYGSTIDAAVTTRLEEIRKSGLGDSVAKLGRMIIGASASAAGVAKDLIAPAPSTAGTKVE